MTYTPEQYATERAIVDAAQAYAESIMCDANGKRVRNYLSKEEAAAPVYAACDNAMRGRVEHFEIMRDLPDSFVAYVSSDSSDAIGGTVQIGVWTGNPLGRGTVCTIGKRRSQYGERQRYGRATIGGKEYRWQGQGRGMYCTLRAVKGAAR